MKLLKPPAKIVKTVLGNGEVTGKNQGNKSWYHGKEGLGVGEERWFCVVRNSREKKELVYRESGLEEKSSREVKWFQRNLMAINCVIGMKLN